MLVREHYFIVSNGAFSGVTGAFSATYLPIILSVSAMTAAVVLTFRTICHAQFPAAASVEFRRVTLHPSPDRDVIDREVPLRLFQIPLIAECGKTNAPASVRFYGFQQQAFRAPGTTDLRAGERRS